jgi:type II secretory pathway predicted ATPase ExeA
MSPSHFESQHPSRGDSAPPSFHNNLHYQEVLATLRYGIVARRGLILLIGDAGTGKSALLHQLTRELDSNVTCIFASDPEVNFTDLLRLLLSHLEVTGDTPGGGLSMMQRCQAILHSQLERGHIVSLVIDNAQRLRDETLEYVLHNFFGAAPADRDEHPLQIVLAGRPELTERLTQPRLRSLKPRSELVCELRPLTDKQIAAYIDNRLCAADLPAGMFDRATVDRIFAYTGGKPRLVNAVCARALRVADETPGGEVTAEMITRAARELDLSEARPPAREAVKPNFEVPRERDEPFRFQLADGDTNEVVGQNFLNYTFDDGRPWLWPPGRDRKLRRVLLTLVLLTGGAAWLQSEAGKSQLANWLGKQSGNVSSQQRLPADANAPQVAKQEMPVSPATPDPLAEPVPGSEVPAPPMSDSATGSLPLPDNEKSAEIPSPVLTEKAQEKPPSIAKPARKPAPKKAPAPPTNDRQPSLADNPGAQRKILEAQVYRAIENRAIVGIDVSVVDGTAVLEGRVATERQKNAAEQAARSVAGVKRVSNRIAVSVS